MFASLGDILQSLAPKDLAKASTSNPTASMQPCKIVFAVMCLAGFVVSPARSGIILESVDWTQQAAPPTAALGGSWSFGSVAGTTVATLNSGQVFPVTWGARPFSSGYSTTVNEGVSLGAINGSTGVQTFSFQNSVSSVYLFFSYLDDGTSFDFGSYSWTLVGANHAYRAGNSVVVSGSADSIDDGFLVNINETFGPGNDLAFGFVNGIVGPGGQTVAFNLAQGAPAAVPEPGTWAGGALLAALLWWRRPRRATGI